MLGRAADALRVWAERDAKMAERIAELSVRLDEAEEFDEARVTSVLGNETARIVAAARDAAAEIRAQAEADAAELTERTKAESEAAADALLNAATTDRAAAERARSEAEQEAAAALASATESAERMVAEATEAAESMVADARAEAEALLAAAREESETLRSDAQSRHDELLESAGRVLEERTAEAEAAALEIRSSAESELEAATETAARELADARAEVERITESAESAAEELREAARTEGREMVDEARDLRRQMLQDAAEKARVGRQKVEAAKAARDAVVNAIRTAGGHLGETLAELEENDSEMRRAADAAALGVSDDVRSMTIDLEKQLDSNSGADPSSGAASDNESDSGDAASGHETDDEPDDEAEEGPADEVAAGGDGPDENADGSRDSATVLSLADANQSSPSVLHGDSGDAEDGSGELRVAELDDSDPDESDLDDTALDDTALDGAALEETDLDGADLDVTDPQDDESIASVHDLFERIRAEDPPADAGPLDVTSGGPTGEGAGPATSEGSNVAVLEAVAPSDPTSEEDASGVSAAVEEAPEHSSEPAEEAMGDSALLARRSELLTPAQKLTTRAVKRLFGDEQNDVLDRVRRLRRNRAEVSDLLGEDDSAALEHFVEVLTEPYVLAASAGCVQWCELADTEHAAPTAADVVDRLKAQVGEILELRRARVRDLLVAHVDAGADTSELVDRIRSVYRDYRGSDAAELAGDLAAGGYSAGSALAAGTEATWRWVVDNGGRPCADAEDNALEGSVVCGSAFPTGDTVPPAHPGCRCIVVPAPDPES